MVFVLFLVISFLFSLCGVHSSTSPAAQFYTNKEYFISGEDTAKLECVLDKNSDITSRDVTIKLKNSQKLTYTLDKFVHNYINKSVVQIIIPNINYTFTGWYTCINKYSGQNIVKDDINIYYIIVGLKPEIPVFQVHLLNYTKLFGYFSPSKMEILKNTYLGGLNVELSYISQKEIIKAKNRKKMYNINISLSFQSYDSADYENCSVENDSFSCPDVRSSSTKFCFRANVSNILGSKNTSWCNKTSEILQPVAVNAVNLTNKTSDKIIWSFKKKDYEKEDYVYKLKLIEAFSGLNVYNIACFDTECGTEKSLHDLLLKPYTLYNLTVRRYVFYNNSSRSLESSPATFQIRTNATYPFPVRWPLGWFKYINSTIDFPKLEIWWPPLKKIYWNDRAVDYFIQLVTNNVNKNISCQSNSSCAVTDVILRKIPIRVKIFSKNSVGVSELASLHAIETSLPAPHFDVEKVKYYHSNGMTLFKFTVYLDKIQMASLKKMNVSVFTCLKSETCENLTTWTREIAFNNELYENVTYSVNITYTHLIQFSASVSSGNLYSGLADMTDCYYGSTKGDDKWPTVSLKRNESHVIFELNAVTCSIHSKSRVSQYVFSYGEIGSKGYSEQKHFPGYTCIKKCVFAIRASPYRSYEFMPKVQFVSKDDKNGVVKSKDLSEEPMKSAVLRDPTSITIGSIVGVLVVVIFVTICVVKGKPKCLVEMWKSVTHKTEPPVADYLEGGNHGRPAEFLVNNEQSDDDAAEQVPLRYSFEYETYEPKHVQEPELKSSTGDYPETKSGDGVPLEPSYDRAANAVGAQEIPQPENTIYQPDLPADGYDKREDSMLHVTSASTAGV